MYIKTSKILLVFSYNIMGDRMEKKLPKVFVNTIQKKLTNNDSVYYGDRKEKETSPKKITYKENINTKINKIFKSPKYVYKINVEITTEQGKQTYNIIGKNMNNLITIDNKLIPISSIIDIKEI